MSLKSFLLAIVVNLALGRSNNVTMGRVKGYLAGVNDALAMFKPGLIDALWTTLHVPSDSVPHSFSGRFNVNSFNYENATATIDPSGVYGYVNITNLVISYQTTGVSLHSCYAYVGPKVGFDWILLRFRVDKTDFCSLDIESLQPTLGNPQVLNLHYNIDWGSCSSKQVENWGENFLNVVEGKILQGMVVTVDSWLNYQESRWLPGWRKIKHLDPFFVLRFLPCFQSLVVTEKDATVDVSVEWNNSLYYEQQEFNMKHKNKNSANDALKGLEIFLSVLAGYIVGGLCVFGGDKYLKTKKKQESSQNQE